MRLNHLPIAENRSPTDDYYAQVDETIDKDRTDKTDSSSGSEKVPGQLQSPFAAI